MIQIFKCYGTPKQISVEKEYKKKTMSIKEIIQWQIKIKNIKDCYGKCKFRSSLNITSEERNLSDDGKISFYVNTTELTVKKQVRNTVVKPKRKYSYRYFFCKRR